MSQHNLRIAVVGAGVSGIAAASVLNRLGHRTVLFEKGSEVGGIWALSYPGVALQNNRNHYALSQFPWPETPDYHPTGLQIADYLRRSVEALKLDLRSEHEVLQMEEEPSGWVVSGRHPGGEFRESFDFALLAVGQYTDWKHIPEYPGQKDFRGRVLTERDIDDLSIFDDSRLVVVGFGKSAVDMAAVGADRSEQVDHVFRTPRWLVPKRILGVPYSKALFCRASTALMPCWDQPNAAERFLHRRLAPLVRLAWRGASAYFRRHVQGHGRDPAARERLARVTPDHGVLGDLRSAAAMAPPSYYRQVADGSIQPHCASLVRFHPDSIELSNGEKLPCDQVLLCVGSESPRFPFLPEKYRGLLEGEADGPQLYRHVLHPDIPKLAFAGYNHGFMHIPSAEVGTLWLSAILRGELVPPSRQEMLDQMQRVREWKREHIHFEPSRSCAVNTRFQQYIDILLRELGLSPYRKLPNPFAEFFGEYGALDYRGLVDEYQAALAKGGGPRDSLTLET